MHALFPVKAPTTPQKPGSLQMPETTNAALLQSPKSHLQHLSYPSAGQRRLSQSPDASSTVDLFIMKIRLECSSVTGGLPKVFKALIFWEKRGVVRKRQGGKGGETPGRESIRPPKRVPLLPASFQWSSSPPVLKSTRVSL